MHGPAPLLGVILAVLELEEGLAKPLHIPAHQLPVTDGGYTGLGKRELVSLQSHLVTTQDN